MFSFIVVSYNTKDQLLVALSSLTQAIAKAAIDAEIIVVDNASNDGTREALEKLDLNVVYNKQNLGFARACNQGAHIASGDILFFVNSDLIMNSEALQKISKTFLDYQQVAIVAPALIDPEGKRETFACAHFPNLFRLLTHSMTYSYDAHSNFLEVDWVSGAALAIRHSVFKELKGFDENFFMYFEDVDLCLRSHRLGYASFFLPQLELVHHRGHSLANNRLRKKYYYKSQSYYFKKHFGALVSIVLRIIRLPLRIKNT